MAKYYLILLFILSVVKAEFDLQYIGDSLNDVEAQGRNFCTTKYCVGDSQILFYSATQNASVDPCLDFKEFSMGTFIKYRALHERYFAIGLLQDTQSLHDERQRKLLAKKVDVKSSGRVFKVMKNFFSKCVSSRNVRGNGKKEIIDYLKSLGGSPLLNGESWDPTKFNLSRILEAEPYYGVLHLLDYEFQTWHQPEGWNKSHAIPSLVKEGVWSWEDDERRLNFNHFNQMLKEMYDFESQNSDRRDKLEVEINSAVERLKSFGEEVNKHKGESVSEITKVKDLKAFTPDLTIDWHKMINDQLLKSVEVTEDDDILLHSPSSLKSLALALETVDKGIIAETFVLKFLYANRFLFTVYPFDWRDERYTSNKRAKQRWEQCLGFVKENMRPGLEMLLTTAHDRDSVKIDQFVKGGVDDFTEVIKNIDESILSKEVKEKTLEKLSKIVILTNSFAHNFTTQHLEEYYDELNLEGNENLVESAFEIQRFYRRIKNDYKDLFTKNSKSSLDSAAQSDLLSYNTLNDEFKVPAVWTFYPWYHPERPKFFNQATLYLDVVYAVKFNIVRYITNVLWYDVQKFLAATDEFKFAYDNYVEWESKGGTDLLLGANRLTTHQLFWLALARSRYRKQKAVPGIEGSDYDRTYFWFKNKEEPLETYDSFREAYHCAVKKNE